MKILKTKKEKSSEAKAKHEENLKEIIEKVEKFGEVTVKYDRKDFKSELSTCCGYGFQDMKKEHQLTITELLKRYKVKFLPDMECTEGFGVIVVIKKK